MPNSKTTNLDLNVGYDENDRTKVWIDGIDSNFELLDLELGTVLKAISDSGIALSQSVELHDEWSTGTYVIQTTLPESFSNTSAQRYGNYIYIFVGKNNSVGDIYKFDTLRYLLTKLDNSIPSGFNNFNTEIYRGTVYLFAGKEDSVASDLIYSYNTSTNEFNVLDIKLTEKRYETSSCIINGIIYIFGGKDENDNDTKSILTIDLDNKSSSTLSLQLPSNICKSTSLSFNDKGYIIGGYNTSIDKYINTILEFNPINSSLNTLNSVLDNGVCSAGVLLVDNNIYLLGGKMQNQDSDLIYKIDVLNDNIALLEFKLPSPLYNFAYSNNDYYGYLFGGILNNTNTNQIVRFVP